MAGPGPKREKTRVTAAEFRVWAEFVVKEVDTSFNWTLSAYLGADNDPIAWDHQDPHWYHKIWRKENGD